MPLDPVAERYAGTIFVTRMEELQREHVSRRAETIANLAKRGIRADTAGQYHVELARVDITHIENLVNAKVDALPAAYDRAHQPIDDGAVAYINDQAAQLWRSQAKFLSQSIRTRGAQSRVPAGATEALVATIATQVASIQARNLRKLHTLRDEQIMAARTAIRPVAIPPPPAKSTGWLHDPRVGIFLALFPFGWEMLGLPHSVIAGAVSWSYCAFLFRSEIVRHARVLLPALEIVLCCAAISYVVWAITHTPLSDDARKIPSLPSKYRPPHAPEISKVYSVPPKAEGKKEPPSKPKLVAPPIDRTDLFMTYLMFNAGNKNGPLACPGASLRAFFCGEFRTAVKGQIPDDENALPDFFGIALQHYLVGLVAYAGEEFGSLGDKPSALKDKLMPPIEIPDAETYELDQALNLTDSDRSLFPWRLNFTHQLRLPRDSRVSFVSTTDPKSYVLRLERSGYYRLDMGVSLLRRYPKGQTPENLDMGFPDTSQITTYNYRVTLNLTVQRTNDPGFVSSDYVE